jgi:hypothetical protein
MAKKKSINYNPNTALIQGAGDAAKSFTDIQGSFMGGGMQYGSRNVDNKKNTNDAILNSQNDPCKDLEGEELVKCQEEQELERLRNEVEGGGVSVNITTDDPPEETE